jgi:alpha-L-fucosidase 2
MRKILLLVLMLAPLAIAVEQNDVEFAKPGGIAMTLDLRVPDGKGPFPAAIIVHGGSFSHGNKRTYVTPLFDVLSDAGFAWFTINYRLAPDHHFPAAVEDVQSAVIWVKSNAAKYRVDPKRIALIGESAGGYLVARRRPFVSRRKGRCGGGFLRPERSGAADRKAPRRTRPRKPRPGTLGVPGI